MDSRIRSTIILHDALHGFKQGGGGAGTAIMETNLEQKLVGIVHEPLFQVLIDVQKAYYSLYRGRRVEIIRGVAWDLKYSGYYRGNGTDRRWFRRQESFPCVLSTRSEE